jgi:hypothetical protein
MAVSQPAEPGGRAGGRACDLTQSAQPRGLTMVYPEKVRFQFLSLRHQISANRTVSPKICENSADLTDDFGQENSARPPQSLSIGAGECIFLHRLCTAVRSLVSDLLEVTTVSERAILNPSPSADTR